MIKNNKRSVWAGLVGLLFCFSISAPASAADPRNGAKLYGTHCSSCHAVNGRGSMPGISDFTRAGTLLKSNAKLVQVIEEGTGIMPAYRGLMSTRDILDVIAHLRAFN